MKKIIALIEILGGILLLITLIFLVGKYVNQHPNYNYHILFFCGIIAAIFFACLSIIAGVFLLKHSIYGKYLSLMTQGFQVVSFNIHSLLYMAFSPFAFIITLTQKTLGFNFIFGAKFLLFYNHKFLNNPSFISINVIALILILLIASFGSTNKIITK